MASGRDLRRDEIVRQREGAGARDRAPGRLGEVARGVNARELRRLEISGAQPPSPLPLESADPLSACSR